MFVCLSVFAFFWAVRSASWKLKPSCFCFVSSEHFFAWKAKVLFFRVSRKISFTVSLYALRPKLKWTVCQNWKSSFLHYNRKIEKKTTAFLFAKINSCGLFFSICQFKRRNLLFQFRHLLHFYMGLKRGWKWIVVAG